MSTRGLVLLIVSFFVALSANAQYRTVIDKDAAAVFQKPNGFPYSDYGAFDGSAPTGSLDPDALQILYGRFLQAGASDASSANGGFPYSALRAYEAQQVAAGQAPIFITATYEGKVRPVLFSWTLNLKNGVPTTPSSNWQYAINVQDSRYVHFWINNYARGVLLNEAYNTRNVWIQLDQSAFSASLYGVLDDTNHFVSGVTWDAPFPQSAGAYLTAIASFFQQVKELAPDINVIPNVGTISDPTQLTTVFDHVPGAMLEDIYSWHASPTAYIRNAWVSQNLTLFPWLAAQNRVAVLRALIPTTDPNALVSAFAVYSLLKGPNFFFAPSTTPGALSIPPSEWQAMEARLGSPTSTMQRQQQPGLSAGYCLFWRNFEGGSVYLNWTGSTQTITLNKSNTYYNPAGQQITELQIPDATGSFITTSKTAAPIPQITPRLGASAAGVQKITLESPVSGAIIRYTENGSEPTSSSPIYSGPIQLSGSAVIKARAFVTGESGSWESSASYTISVGLPTVEFLSSSDSGSAGYFYPVLALSGVPQSTVLVTYTVQQPSGATSTGTVSFLPGQAYRDFRVTATGSSGQIAAVRLDSATGAIVGSKDAFSATIQ
jgi:hypothetical protein